MRGIWGTGRAVALVGVAALLAGCWGQVGYGAHHRRHNDVETGLTQENAATLTEVWSAAVPGTVSEPIVDQGRIYVTRANSSPSASVGARALDAGTGATVWDTQLLPGGDGITSFPQAAAIADGALWSGGAMVFSFGSTVRCGANAGRLDLDDGAVASTFADDLFSPAVSAGGFILQTTTSFGDPAGGFCTSGPVSLIVRDPATLAVLWSATLPNQASGPLVPYSSLPTVADGRVYVANGTTLSAYALEGCGAETCDPLWSIDLGGTVDRSTPVALSGGNVVVTLTAGQVVAVEGLTGIEQWRALLDASLPIDPPLQVLAADGDTVYVTVPSGTGTGENRLLAYPAEGCAGDLCDPAWVGTAPGAALTSPPTVAGGVVYVGADDAVLAFDADGCGSSTCAPFATIPLDGTATSITVAQGRLYASGPDHVTAFAPA